MRLVGRGYSSPKLSPTETHSGEPDQTIVVEVSGPGDNHFCVYNCLFTKIWLLEPGYAATSIFVFEAAMTIREELDQDPPNIPRYNNLFYRVQSG